MTKIVQQSLSEQGSLIYIDIYMDVYIDVYVDGQIIQIDDRKQIVAHCIKLITEIVSKGNHRKNIYGYLFKVQAANHCFVRVVVSPQNVNNLMFCHQLVMLLIWDVTVRILLVKIQYKVIPSRVCPIAPDLSVLIQC